MRILLVDDETQSREHLARFLRSLGHLVVECADGGSALAIFQKQPFHLILTDIRMPKMTGLELLQRVRNSPSGQEVDVVLFTGYGDLQSSVQAMRAGAYDYLLKPVNIEELVAVTERVAERQALIRENNILSRKFEDAVRAATEDALQELSKLKRAYTEAVGIGNVVVISDKMKQVIDQAMKLHGNRSIPVLIEGETGTGKEVVARLIHFGEDNDTAPFVDVNCASFSPGVFESELFGYEAGAFTGGLPKGQKGKLDLAQGGTLFLDEITELSMEQQAKLLRVLQEKEFYRVGGLKKIKTDVRIICATNVPVEKRIRDGAFRQDLYYRLNVARIKLPPLRDRRDEILPLAETFLNRFAKEKGKSFKGIGKDAADLLLNYAWPGNVRELKNLMEWITVMYDDVVLSGSHLGSLKITETIMNIHIQRASGTIDCVESCEALYLPPESLSLERLNDSIILKALQMHHGNKAETARYLGIARRTFYRRLQSLTEKNRDQTAP